MLQASTSDPISALLQQVINSFASMGDTKQSLFVFAYDDGSRGYGELQLHLTRSGNQEHSCFSTVPACVAGCNMHPNVATHQYMADQIRSTVAQVTGWQ